MKKMHISALCFVTILLISLTIILIEGREKTTLVVSTGLVINEYMLSNKSTIADEDGDFSDWVELLNSGNSPINLKDYSLSDDGKKPVKWRFSDYTLQPGQFLIVFASGKDKHPKDNSFFHTSFKLSEGDGSILLSKNGRIVDEVTLVKTNSDFSSGRDFERHDIWRNFDKPTPSYPNNDRGYEDFVSNRKLKESPVVINEVMSANKSTLRDEDWDYSDWVEIRNISDKPLNLTNYRLTDDASNLSKWKFPEITIDPKGYALIFASGKDKKEKKSNNYHTNFKLSSYSEKLIFSDSKGKILDEVNLKGMSPDISFGRTIDDINKWTYFKRPTPGYENNGKGYSAFLKNTDSGPALVLTEAMAVNSVIKDEDGDFSDWVEICNRKNVPLDLSDFFLTDNINSPNKWNLPDKSLSPGQYMIIFLSGKNRRTSSSKYAHANFKLDKSSDSIFISDKSGSLVDKLVIDAMPAYASIGKSPVNEGYLYFDTPTPGYKNSNGYYDIASAPIYSIPGGFYNDRLTLELTSSVANTRICYTLDGSSPGPNSPVYTSPISINKTIVVKARCFINGLLPGPTVTNTFFIKPDKNLTTISISTNPSNLWNESDGIYVKGNGASPDFPYVGANFWKDIEKPIHMELYETDGKNELSIDAGIKIYGAYSRAMDQKSFAIFARDRYGADSIDYQFFESKPVTKFKSIVLRTSGQDATFSKIRDILMTGLAGEMGLDVQAYKQSVLYINGQYWGIYNIREKINEEFLASNYNISNPDNIDLLVANGRALSGDDSNYKSVLNFVSKNDMSQKKNYEYIKTQVDVTNLMDYLIAEMYFGNTDTGNIKFWRERVPEGKWRWIVYDTDWGFFNVKHNSVAFNLNPEGTGVGKFFSTLLRTRLMQNAEFKREFLSKFAKYLNTTFKPQKVVSRIDELSKNIEAEMPKQLQRWGGSMKGWQNQLESLRNFARQRPSYLYTYIQEYFHLTNSEMASFGFNK